MVQLLQRLIELLKDLQPGPRTSPDALGALLRALATHSIQEDPAQAVIPPGDWPAEVVAAIEEGASRAATLNAAGIRLRVEVEELPVGTPAGQVTDRPSATFGPFVDSLGRLLRFTAHESRGFLTIIRRPAVAPPETLLMIPLESAASDAANQAWTLPAGTVWIRARLLVAGVPDYAGLRISGGTLQLTGAVVRDGNQMFLTDLAPWTLSIDPEQPEGARARRLGRRRADDCPARHADRACGRTDGAHRKPRALRLRLGPHVCACTHRAPL